MKTRRNRKGGANFLSGLFGSTPAQTAQPAQPLPEATLATPVPEGKEMPEAMISPEAQVLTPTPAEKPSGNATVDKAVADLYDLKPEFRNYHMRALINAIGVCNSTEKMQNNAAGIGNSVLNTFGRGNEAKLEMTQCGTQCKERSEKVKAALKELLRIGDGNDALGYIGSVRVAVNTAGYLGNSAYSIGKKVGLFKPTAPAEAMPGQVAQQTQPTQGGRRRTRRR
jgi:hypothetical protein